MVGDSGRRYPGWFSPYQYAEFVGGETLIEALGEWHAEGSRVKRGMETETRRAEVYESR